MVVPGARLRNGGSTVSNGVVRQVMFEILPRLASFELSTHADKFREEHLDWTIKVTFYF